MKQLFECPENSLRIKSLAKSALLFIHATLKCTGCSDLLSILVRIELLLATDYSIIIIKFLFNGFIINFRKMSTFLVSESSLALKI